MASDVSGPQVALTACSSSTNPSGPTPYCTLSLTGGLEDKNGDLALIREAHAAGSGAKISKSPSARQRHGSVRGHEDTVKGSDMRKLLQEQEQKLGRWRFRGLTHGLLLRRAAYTKHEPADRGALCALDTLPADYVRYFISAFATSSPCEMWQLLRKSHASLLAGRPGSECKDHGYTNYVLQAVCFKARDSSGHGKMLKSCPTLQPPLRPGSLPSCAELNKGHPGRLRRGRKQASEEGLDPVESIRRSLASEVAESNQDSRTASTLH
eukprot:s2567_g1.t1